MDQPIRLLVVDDSALYRQTIVNVLRGFANVSIVGVARDGAEALRKVEELDPDLLTLDVQMPAMDGIAVLKEIKRRGLRAKAIMVSSLTNEGARVTTDALLEGAFDFVLKPSGAPPQENRRALRNNLEEKINAFLDAVVSTRLSDGHTNSIPRIELAPPTTRVCQAVIIGVSTGGPAALKSVLPAFPGEMPVPVLIVQHMPSQFTEALARRLDSISQLEVREAGNGMEVRAGSALVAPGGRQMRLERRANQVRVKLTDDPPENGVRPSVDYLLRSVAEVFNGQALGVIMTGMGHDGLEGCRDLKSRGGSVFAQHPFGCVVYGMPKAIIDNNLADRVLPLSRIGPAIVSHLRTSTSK